MIRIVDKSIQQFEIDHMENIRRIAQECTLLLKKDGNLPLEGPCKIAAYGRGVRKTVKGGTGSGDVNVRHFVTVEEGLEKAGFEIISKDWLDLYDSLVEEEYKRFIEDVKREANELGINPVMYGMGKSMPEPNYNFSLKTDADAALYVLSRNSGEGTDREVVAGDIELSETEIRDICFLNEKYDKFILVLNTGGMVNLDPVNGVKNILLLGQLGTVTGDVLADLLLGQSYPSGKLTMTWAAIDDYPSTEGFGDMDDTRYHEGIYVGYRYFDSIGKKPAYPFGYGLSYTVFSIETKSVEVKNTNVVIKVAVKNTGSFAGKEVVQVYTSSPVGKLNQPYQKLSAFVKTDEILPGEMQVVTLEFNICDLASYDTESASYILEKGLYRIRVGNSSNSTNICAALKIQNEITVKRVKNICKGWDFEDLSLKSELNQDDLEDVPIFNVNEKDVEIETIEYSEYPKELESKVMCTWQDVMSKKNTLDDFVGTLDVEQLIYTCMGLYHDSEDVGSMIGASAVSVAGAAGETTDRLANLDVPHLVMADGPAGLRLCTQYKVIQNTIKGIDNSLANFMDFMEQEQIEYMMSMIPKETEEERIAPINYMYCVAIPIGTCLAQSWNEEVAWICGDIVGVEMELFGVKYWLAPAMNIQRSPLCGRNFEYYSEDPLLSGCIGAAVTNGVQRHKGCGTTIKHFAANNQETNRQGSNSIVSERALREIYLRGFEICIKKSNPEAVMSSYNLINGEHTCNSKDLLTYVLRDEWGYNGIVMTDWYAADDIMIKSNRRPNKYISAFASGCIHAGNDLIMPGISDEFKDIKEALEMKKGLYPITKAELQVTAKRVLNSILRLQ